MNITKASSDIKLENYIGTWHMIDSKTINSKEYFLLEHETYGDETANVIVDANSVVILDDVWNGFYDLEEHLGI